MNLSNKYATERTQEFMVTIWDRANVHIQKLPVYSKENKISLKVMDLATLIAKDILKNNYQEKDTMFYYHLIRAYIEALTDENNPGNEFKVSKGRTGGIRRINKPA